MRYAAALLALVVLGPDFASAQGGDSLSFSALRQSTLSQMEALARLKPGNTVRVHVPGQGWLGGSVIRNRPDSLVLGDTSEERIVPTSTIDSMLVRHSEARMGAAVGALLGFIVGAQANCAGPPATSLGQAAAEIGPQLDCAANHVLGGLAVGALVGALIGSAIPSWEQRLPIEKTSTQ